MPKTYEDLLSDFLEDGGDDEHGERNMRCPLHNDTKRSASINFGKGLWFCHACGKKGKVSTLIKEMGLNVKAVSKAKSSAKAAPKEKPKLTVGEEDIHNWCQSLSWNKDAQKELFERRGLNKKTVATYEIGWDTRQGAYTIPVYDQAGELVNVRFYKMDPGEDRRKIWSIKGSGGAALYPYSALEKNVLIICEGEWDALLTTQNGFPAITRTGAASVWDHQWSPLFSGKTVYVCQDSDFAGQAGNKKIMESIRHHAKQHFILPLPFPILEKHGKDLTDFWMEGGTKEEFVQMLLAAKKKEVDKIVDQAEVLTVMDSLGSAVGKKVRINVTVTGRTSTPYIVPKSVVATCDKGAGPKCDTCTMYATGDSTAAQLRMEFQPWDPIILEMVNSTSERRDQLVRQNIGVPKCVRFSYEADTNHNVEELFVRPSIDDESHVSAGQYVNRKVFGVGSHDDMPNTSLSIVGSVFPSPKDAKNEFLAWEIERRETDLDKFKMTKELKEDLSVFQCDPRYVLEKCTEIAEDLADNVTEIMGRTTMHVFMDLVYHSALAFPFGNKYERRGWLDAIIIGDTRTGKSEAAERLVEHYGIGQIISCESASFAGVVGGLDQVGGKEWIVKWGAIPLNDGRLVVLDEISGLTTEQIGSMSSIRSSGIAQLTKIQSEKTAARTRLLWLGNPRPGKGSMRNSLDRYTFSVKALLPLIGTAEDIARFDMAMCIRSDEVSTEQINSGRKNKKPHVYTHELCHELVKWVWTRTIDQIVWKKTAEEEARKGAIYLAHKFGEDPPLIQGANARIKIARIACAFAARTFSCDASGNKIVIHPEHVSAAIEFLVDIYDNTNFGYGSMSRMNEYKPVAEEDVSRLELASSAMMSLPEGEFSFGQFMTAHNIDETTARSFINELSNIGAVVPVGNGYTLTETARKSQRNSISQKERDEHKA